MRAVRHHICLTVSAFLGLAVALAIAANGVAAQDKWISKHYTDHPLAGTIWTSDFKRTTMEELEKSASAADFVLLGEIHDNPDHHLLQAKIIRALTADGRHPAIVFEMIPVSLQAELDRNTRGGVSDAGKLGEVLHWKKLGWPDWTIYQPIAEAALSANLAFRAGGLDRDVQKTIPGPKPSPVYTQMMKKLGLSQPLKPEIVDALSLEIKEGHCNLLPEAAIAPIIKIQRARDAQLAKSMLAAEKNSGAVLIAGSGHIRNDWAVPSILHQARRGRSSVSIAFFEVTPEHTSPSEYINAIQGAAKPFDFIFFTPRADLTDHCAEMRKHMEKKKSGKTGRKDNK